MFIKIMLNWSHNGCGMPKISWTKGGFKIVKFVKISPSKVSAIRYDTDDCIATVLAICIF